MPIRFRCAYCNQLMGISTRKAGTVVKCPKCAGEIIVPSPDSAPASEEPAESSDVPPGQETAASAPSPAAAFEAKEFEDYFNEAANGSAAATAPVRTDAAPPEALPEPVAPPPAPPPPPPLRRGLFLTLPALFVSIVVILLLLVLMFVLGVVIGRHAAAHESTARATRPQRTLAHL